tara:strand:+ start:409 stop:759 length:351 start_codon:yes stop_codon:yes gene_type:complete
MSWETILKIKLTHTFTEGSGLKVIEIKAGEDSHGSFFVLDDKLVPFKVTARPARQGIGTKIYDYAEKITGLPVKNESLNQTEDARKFWEKRTGEENKPSIIPIWNPKTNRYDWVEG